MKRLIIISAILIAISSCTCFGCQSGAPGNDEGDGCDIYIYDRVLSDTRACSEEGVCSGCLVIEHAHLTDGSCNGTCRVSSTGSSDLSMTEGYLSGSCTFPSTFACDIEIVQIYGLWADDYYCQED